MQRFECLSRDCPLFGPHLLEASAGTGKTFSIEHIYVRLILESQKKEPIDLEKILTVTFTRAATRELKARIRANLEKALSFLRSQNREGAWEYLKPYLASGFASDSDREEAIRALGDALAVFDRCQIFTIHGFCWRMLQEFAFEAKGSFSLADPDEDANRPRKTDRAVRDFLEQGIDPHLLCPEQAAALLKQFSSLDEIGQRLSQREEGAGFSFSAFHEQCKAALQKTSCIEAEKAVADFRSLEKGYKQTVKGDFEGQAAALARFFSQPNDPLPLRLLLKEKGSLFSFLDLSNRKVKATAPNFLHYPGFFDEAAARLYPLIQEAHRKILPTLQAAWNSIAERCLPEEDLSDPDEILAKMQKAMENGAFAAAVQKKYAAAIVDEFQDTDAAQWEIFRRLFIEGSSLRALYLVGDPKQSIYRFRKADIYVYLKARTALGEGALYYLDTNFRSSKSLVGALNALFSRDWLRLPKENRTLPYLPVKAGSSADSSFSDAKGALHFFLAEGGAKELFEIAFLPFVVQEIERQGKNSFAVLVKDRHQAEKTLHFLRQRGIEAVARSRAPLAKTFAFQALRELFDAILSPQDANASEIVAAGPFGSPEETLPFAVFKKVLEEKGIVPFCSLFLKTTVQGISIRERIVSYDLSFYRDLVQIFEELFDREANEGFSFGGLNRFFAGSQERAERRMEADEDAVQVMTLHASKGLEFDIVFALGLAAPTPEAEEEAEELNAEKLRQLYVAMTRAKRRLYVPAVLSSKEKKEASTQSPMELFCACLEKESPLPDLLRSLGQKESITFETLPASFSLPPKETAKNVFPSLTFVDPKLSYSASGLFSFTSLAQTKEEELKKQEGTGFTLHTLPRGADTGIAIHALFEKIFSSSPPVWRDRDALEKCISEGLRFSPLSPWEESLQQMVRQTLSLSLNADGETFSLQELDPQQLQVEMEFLFDTPPHFVKGFIDLVFRHRGKYYFLDWKTNWLGENESAYDPVSLQKAMEAHDYPFQAALYAEALRRHLNAKERFPELFGGAFYLFLRGEAYVYLQPNLNLIRERYGKPLPF